MCLRLHLLRYLYCLLVLLLTGSNSYAQLAADTGNNAVDQRPVFDGGDKKLASLVQHYIVYPQPALYDSVEGTVVVSFIINENGVMLQPAISRAATGALDTEALRVVKLVSNLFPRWAPGKHNGVNTSMQDSVEVVFNVHAYEVSHRVRHTDIWPMPGFDLNKFIAGNLVYPKKAKENNVQGTVNVKFLISEDGSLSEFSVQRPVSPELDAEALRIARKMPKWNPGRKNRQPVKTYFNIPIPFTLP